jgi:hypothetical protein
MENTEQYPYIKAWSKFLGSGAMWTDVQVARAIADQAPSDAIYYAAEEVRWMRAAEITNDNIRNEIYAIVSRQRIQDMQA